MPIMQNYLESKKRSYIKIMKIVMCGYGNPDNRGCEAIIRTTTAILKEKFKDSEIIAMSNDFKRVEMLDIPWINQYERSYYPHEHTLDFYVYAVLNKVFGDTLKWCYIKNHKAYKSVGKVDLCVSVGGDNFCYHSHVDHFIVHHDHFKKQGAKLVHWGSSFEENLMDQHLIHDLNRFDAIIVRESLSRDTLLKARVSAPVYLVPDPAFFLEVNIPTKIDQIAENCVGVNISPMIISRETKSGMTRKNTINLINYITDAGYPVLLIPHVADRKNGEGDYSVMKEILAEIKSPEKCKLIGYNYSASEYKYFISKCRFFVGSRTHATIAAYSTNVPTLVIGYSVKARGIAKDIFGTDINYVIPVQSLEKEDQMKEAFQWLEYHENEIRERLETFMPKYCNESKKAIDIINSICDKR